MKTIFIAIFIAYAAIITGQSLSEFSQDSVLYLTDKQEAFMIDKETKYLFKTGPLGFEKKLNESISLNTVFQPTYSGASGFRLESGLELRYYYKMSKLIEQGKQADNLSSEYFSAGVGYIGAPFIGNGNAINSFSYNINWGSQRRFLNYGYIDVGIRLDYSTYEYKFPGNSTNPLVTASFLTLSNKTAVGFAFGKNYEISDVVKCPIFKCNLDMKSAVKYNLNKLFSLSYGTSSVYNNDYRFGLNLNPEISYEYKLGSSPISINQELDILLGFSSKISELNPNAGLSEYRIGYLVSLRHYFQLNSRIKKGKSGNNLSGFYWYGGGSFQYGDSKLPLYVQESEEGKHNYLDFIYGIGYQKTMLNNFYFDFHTGMTVRVNEIVAPRNSEDHYEGGFIDFKIGKLF